MTSNSLFKAGVILTIGAVLAFAGAASVQAAPTIKALSTATPGGGAVSVASITANAISPDASLVVGQAVFDGTGIATPFLYNVSTDTIYNLANAAEFRIDWTLATSAAGVGISDTGLVTVLVNGKSSILGTNLAFLWQGDSTGVGAYTFDDIRQLSPVASDNSTGYGLAVQMAQRAFDSGTGATVAGSTVTDAGKFWVPDQWKLYNCTIAGVDYVITGNTDTVLTVTGTPPAGTQDYEIRTQEVMVAGTWVDGSNQKGFRYRTQPSFLNIDKPPSSNYANNVYAISAFADIAGYSSNCQVGGGNHRESWTWTSSTYTWLANLDGGPNNVSESASRGNGFANQIMSLDGLCVVGRSTQPVDDNWHAFRQIGGLTAGGFANVEDIHTATLPLGQTYSEAQAVNGYGTVIAGYAMNIAPNRDKTLFIWDAANTMRDFPTVAGNPAGWTFNYVSAFSQDGATAIGTGTKDGVGESWILTNIYEPPLPPPPPSIVVVTDDTFVVGQAYTKTLTLSTGRLPVPTWTLGSAPAKAGLAVTPAGKGATVSGWTPMTADIGAPSTVVTVEAASSAGSDSKTWNVTVVAPNPPTVGSPLISGNTQLTVSGLYSFTNKVELYKNGAKVAETTTDLGGTSYTFTGLAAFVVGDCYTATQTTGDYTTAQSDQVCVRAPYAPTINPVLLPGGTSITVSGVYTFATQVDLYWNGGATPVATATAPPSDFSTGTCTFTVAAMVAGEYFTATQTAGGATSAQSLRRYVMPLTLNICEDFETDPLDPQWVTVNHGLPFSTVQAHSPTRSGIQHIDPSDNKAGQIRRDVTPVAPDGAYRNPIVVEYWLYESPPTPLSGATQRGGIYAWTGGAWGSGYMQYAYEVGVGSAIGGNDTSNNPSPADATTFDPSYYYGNLVQFNSSGTAVRSTQFLLNDPLAPRRVAGQSGWHKFSIKIGANKAWWYVDGQRGKRKLNATPTNLCNVWAGSWSGSIDLQDSFYDDICAKTFTEHDTTLSSPGHPTWPGTTFTATATVGAPFSLTVVGSDVDTPDTLKMSTLGTLPAGLSATVNGQAVTWPISKEVCSSPTAGPTATLVISGTPTTVESRGFSVTTTDDVAVGGRQATGTITISVVACTAPTVTSIAPAEGAQGATLTGVAVGGTNFTSGATVKLTKSGEADIVATNVVVGSATGLTCDLNLTGAAVGKWSVVVTTCASAILADAFEVKAACNAPAQDVDGDHDVDLTDFGVFQSCFNGPNRAYALVPPFDADCKCLDVEPDGDVDLADFGKFQSCFNGPNRLPASGC